MNNKNWKSRIVVGWLEESKNTPWQRAEVENALKASLKNYEDVRAVLLWWEDSQYREGLTGKWFRAVLGAEVLK